MAVLVNGGDNTNPIKSVLNPLGADAILHWDGRSKNSVTKRKKLMSSSELRSIVEKTSKRYQIPAQSSCACSLYKIITMHYRNIPKKELISAIKEYVGE